MERLLVIPAAGLGSRLGGTIPKLLVPVNGRPMIEHLLDLYAGIAERAAVVVHPSARAAVDRALGKRVDLLVQQQPTGMLDAILAARPAVERYRPRRILITWCDQIGIQPATVKRLHDAAQGSAAAPLVMPTCVRPDPYIHLERDGSGRIVRVLHRREGDAMPPEGESDAGVFDLSLGAYLDHLLEYERDVERGSATGERNFLPFVPWLSARAIVRTVRCTDPAEAIGVNTPGELQAVEAYLRGVR
jgi:bifunctional N-acetylglucosamine-1-phosphate-uridyltransferase/glucosamine-1-phosphate-acetyltransferase GlmU-like protein